MILAVDSVRAELEAILGASDLISERTGCEAFAVDGMTPEFAVKPSTAEKVAEFLAFANEHDLALIAIGSGTKLSTGTLPQRYDAALSLGKLGRIIQFEPGDLTITVEAGMKFGELQELAGRNGLWLPLDPRGGARSTIGGIIASNAAGPLRQAYGGPRDMVLGLKIATTDGRIVKTGGRVVKNVAGYDLGKLLTGSFGTLGVIVEASLKLFTKPRARETFLFQARTLGNARQLRKNIGISPLDPLRIVVIDGPGAALVHNGTARKGGDQAELWIEVSGSERVLKRCENELQRLASATGMLVERHLDSEASWDRMADLAAWLKPSYPEATVLKAALPSEASEEFLSHARSAAEAEQIPLAGFAQAGVGIVHTCLLQRELTDGAGALVKRLRDSAAELGGTLIVEHCPPTLKRQIDVWGARGDDIEAMRKVKSAWDPKSILSPGRFVGGI